MNHVSLKKNHKYSGLFFETDSYLSNRSKYSKIIHLDQNVFLSKKFKFKKIDYLDFFFGNDPNGFFLNRS